MSHIAECASEIARESKAKVDFIMQKLRECEDEEQLAEWGSLFGEDLANEANLLFYLFCSVETERDMTEHMTIHLEEDIEKLKQVQAFDGIVSEIDQDKTIGDKNE